MRGYAQHDPLVEYKRESFDMFEAMMQRFQEDTVRYLYLMQVVEREAPARPMPAAPAPSEISVDGGDGRPRRRAATSLDEIEEAFQRRKRRELEQASLAGAGDSAPVQTIRRAAEKIGRNDPCPCGSGKKYKKCHGTAA